MAPCLPDEILVKIIKANIKPYYLTVRKDPYEAFLRGKAWHLMYSGIQSVMNLLLANKMFHEETMTAVKKAFNGNLLVEHDAYDLLAEEFRVGKGIHAWLKHRIDTLSVSGIDIYHDFLSIKPILAIDCTPNLRKLILTDDKVIDYPDYSDLYHTVGLAEKFLGEEIRDHLEENGVNLDILQTRKLRLTINRFFGDEQNVAVVIVKGFPSRRGRYNLVCSESYDSAVESFHDMILDCVTKFWD